MNDHRRSELVPARALAALAALGLGLLPACGSKKEAPLKFETAVLGRADISSMVTATGTLSPLVTVEVGSQVSGRILELKADFNSKVTKGQTVARIDPALFESEVVQARANLEVAQAGVKSAEAELADARRKQERASALATKNLVSQAEADTALATLESKDAGLVSARARLAQARAALDRAQTNLAYTVIVSPIDGVVISRAVDVGQTVAASLQAPKLFTIAEDLRKMEVHTSVAESDVGRLSPGMEVEFTVDAYQTDRFEGTVKEVRYSPTTVQNVVTYDAVVSVENEELKLRPGMTADVSFLVERQPGVLAVPNAALRFKPPSELLSEQPARPAGNAAAAAGGPPPGASGDGPPAKAEAAGRERAAGKAHGSRRQIWKLGADGKPVAVRVQVGISDGRMTAVSGEGLAEGDQIIVGSAGGSAAGGGSGAQKNSMRPPGRFL